MSSNGETPSASGLGPASAPRVHAGVAEVELDGETVVYDERSGGLHRLNAPATIVWKCLDGDVTVAELAAEIAEVSGAEPAQIEADVLAAVRDFEALGLLDDGRPCAQAPDEDQPDDRPEDPPAASGPRAVEVPGST